MTRKEILTLISSIPQEKLEYAYKLLSELAEESEPSDDEAEAIARIGSNDERISHNEVWKYGRG